MTAKEAFEGAERLQEAAQGIGASFQEVFQTKLAEIQAVAPGLWPRYRRTPRWRRALQPICWVLGHRDWIVWGDGRKLLSTCSRCLRRSR